MLSRIKARMLLAECRGDEIWSPQTCKNNGVPEAWIEELSDTFESGFKSDSETIYEQGKLTNQFHGVHDLALAHKLAEFLGVDARRATEFSLSRESEVAALKEAVDEI